MRAGGTEVSMQVYEGVVQNRVVILPQDVHLEDGLRVEIRIPEMEGESAEALLKQRLVELGLLAKARKPGKTHVKQRDRTPIRVEGKPLSEQIIEERR
jgi:hypothetical protein